MFHMFVSSKTEETTCSNCGRGCDPHVELEWHSPDRPSFKVKVCPECAKRLSQGLLEAAWKETENGKEQGKRN